MRDFIDSFLIESLEMGAKWALRIWVPSSSFIVLGRFSKLNEEVKDGAKLPIRRRLGGGCAVVLYPGTIILSVAVKRALNPMAFPKQWIMFFNEIVISALEKVGLENLKERGWGDITYGDKKIGGISLFSSRKAILYQLSLIYKLDLSLISDNLKHPPREPDYRRSRDHREFLTSIYSIAPEISAADLMNSLEKEIKKALLSL